MRWLLLILILGGCATKPLEIQSTDHLRWKPQEITTEGLPRFKSIKQVNKYVNQVAYVADVDDDWKTPQRFFKEGGDCEDYVIAKKTLIELSGLSHDAEMVLVFDKFLHQHHMVLVVNNKVLDNQTDEMLYWEKTTTRYSYIASVK